MKALKQLFLLALVLMGSFSASAQADPFTITGSVLFSEEGLPIPGIEVSIIKPDGSTDFVPTDDLGIYTAEYANPSGILADYVVELIDFCTGEIYSEVVTNDQPEAVVDFEVCAGIFPPPPPEGCEAYFSYDIIDPANFLQVQFYDLSYADGDIDSWEWDFGDNNTSTEQNPVHTYAEEGDYEVILTITSDTCTSTIIHPVHVGDFGFEDCEAVFFTLPAGGLSVAFIDVSFSFFDPIDSWSWDFGDGEGSNEQSPVHTYAEEGLYIATLTITAGDCESSFEQTIFVEDAGDIGCNALFDYAPTNGLEVQFYGFTDSYFPVDSWEWDFGDGGTANEQFPLHTYAEEGEYDVTLTVTIDTCISSFTMTVQVFDFQQPDCYADFFPFPGPAPLTYDFIDYSYSFNDPIDSWEWDFGDGETGEGPAVTHTYSEAGIYVVTLTITAGDCESTIQYDVEIIDYGDDCWALFYPEFDPANPNSVQFVDNSYGGTITSWEWDFGDGNTSDEQNPFHTYAEEGIYEVSLTITTAEGCENTYFNHICIGQGGYVPMPGCQAMFFFEQDPNDMMTFSFLDMSMGENLEYDWDFGDGQTSTEQNPVYTYTEEGIYQVALTVSNDSCSSSFSLFLFTDPEVWYQDECNALFLPLITSETDEVFFLNLSSFDAIGFEWDFGDGNTSTESNPVHVYDEEGIYTVSLTITTANGCTSTFEITLNTDGSGLTGDVSASALVLSTETTQVRAEEIRLYPNPVSNFLFVQFPESVQADAQLRIMDARGQMVLQPGQAGANNQKEISVDNLPGGLYFLQIETAEGFVSKRFIKQ
jgi:PKD repeat protein